MGVSSPPQPPNGCVITTTTCHQDWTVKYYVQLGADRQKLVVGIPTYGRTFTLADENFSEYGSAAIGPGQAGNYTNEKGFMPFYEVGLGVKWCANEKGFMPFCEVGLGVKWCANEKGFIPFYDCDLSVLISTIISLPVFTCPPPYLSSSLPVLLLTCPPPSYLSSSFSPVLLLLTCPPPSHLSSSFSPALLLLTCPPPYLYICEAMSVNGWVASKPFPRAMGPYAHHGNQWVGYDDEGIVATKAEYVRDYGLGGIMFWSMDTDDFHGICSGRPYLLIETGKAALLSDSRTDLNKLDNGNGVTIAPPVTPIPPTTPSPTPSFICKREGFHPNPENCHQYYWCLGSSGDMVAHTFTCPSGLVFSKSVDGCEHPDRARCDEKKKRGGADATPATPTIPTTTPFPPFDYDYYYFYEDEDYVDPADSPASSGRTTPAVTTTTTTTVK
ncbi:Chitin binding domain [Trinorchestia longiramus]|nr:Chitin binding domain [Trinorchestia longiramus]